MDDFVYLSVQCIYNGWLFPCIPFDELCDVGESFFFIVFWRAWIVFVVEKLDSGQPVAVDISVRLLEVCIAFEWLLLNIRQCMHACLCILQFYSGASVCLDGCVMG